MTTLRIYQYPNCGTCKKALRWLDAAGIAYQSIDIVKSPPERALLEEVSRRSGVPVSKMFNTSGEAYRAGGYKDRLKTLSEAEAFGELAKNGKLIKRPILVGARLALVGFSEEQYSSAFSGARER